MNRGSTRHQILFLLAEDGGFTTHQVAVNVDNGSGSRHSAQIRQALLSMERDGLVTKMDDQKPVCWLRTKKGTEAFQTSG